MNPRTCESLNESLPSWCNARVAFLSHGASPGKSSPQLQPLGTSVLSLLLEYMAKPLLPSSHPDIDQYSLLCTLWFWTEEVTLGGKYRWSRRLWFNAAPPLVGAQASAALMFKRGRSSLASLFNCSSIWASCCSRVAVATPNWKEAALLSQWFNPARLLPGTCAPDWHLKWPF